MNSQTHPHSHSKSSLIKILTGACCLSIFLLSQAVFAQQTELSLADFLIALRSKKATLAERNKLLTEAAKQRGVTFALTPEIEKELESTGADKELVEAIRSKGAIVKASALVPAKTEPAEPIVVAPPPPDRLFYVNRASTSFAKGEFDPAIADYSKAIEFNANEAMDFVGRGMAYYSKRSYDLALADFDKAIELKPSAIAYVNRAFTNEKKGSPDKAMADFQKAIDLDAGNETAKINLKRLQDDQAKALAKARELEAASKPAPPPPVVSTVRPESIDLGQLNASQAVRLVKPIYSAVAMRSGIYGKVVVNLTLDEEGNVKSADATSGPSLLRSAAEDAARRSKIKPAMLNNIPIKATATIVYNFAKASEEE
jgi:TonB family protein